jgi:transposase-like protein
MPSTLTLTMLQQATARYLTAKQQVSAEWTSPCPCATPGESRQCLECPAFKAFVLRIQQRLIQTGETDDHSFPICTVPNLAAPDSDIVQQQVLSLYQQGFTLLEIQRLTGVRNKRVLRAWLYGAGLLRKQKDYSGAEREQAMALYQEGLTPQQVEEKTSISADAVASWASDGGISRAKVNYSLEQRQRSLELYQQGKTLNDIAAETGVHGPTVCAWGKAMGIKRPKNRPGRPRVHSDEVRQNCIDMVLKEGKKSHRLNLPWGSQQRRYETGFGQKKRAIPPMNHNHRSFD